MASPRNGNAPSIAESLREYGRGLAGGLLFSLPLLYTMEMWWTGFIASPERLLLMLVFTFVLLLGYNRFAGLREDASAIEIAIDSVEELGLGLITAAGVLYLLGRIGPGVAWHEVIGKTVVEASVVAIGYSIGTAQLGIEENTGLPGQSEKNPSFAGHLLLAFCGAIVFAANVAPTEEVVMIAIETGAARLAGLALLSVGLAALVLYHVRFVRSDRFSQAEGALDVVVGSAATYATALVATAVVLWFFGRYEGHALDICIAETIVLGFPAVLGASAGRLLL
ncbi:MAG TPA: TIGR02587 family membrane protein, partial [Thermoanaerobaculia bacterium]